MSNKIPRSFIDQLLSRVDIVEVIDARVKLRKSGANHFACCPFHNEKSASFTVSQAKQFYYCFGCGASGNAVGFLIEFEHMTFVEAIETLAQMVGMPIPEEVDVKSKDVREKTTNYYQLLIQVMRYYQHQLRHHKDAATAIDYLKDRGLTGEVCKRFAIGFAPEGFHNLQTQFGREIETQKALLATGMLIQKDKNVYDRFRYRIVFPIRDPRGRVLGFGGRVLDDATPKYLNSPETPIYHKGHELYGLYELLQAKRNIEKIILVEGYMDVVSLAQFGVDNAVATLGTATSYEHLKRLFRYCEQLIFCFDGDKAGQTAAWRALQVALPLMQDGRQIRFCFLPEGMDPDDYVRTHGSEAFNKLCMEAPTLSDYMLSHISHNLDLKSMESKAKFAHDSLQLIKQIPDGVLHEMLLDQINRIVQLSPQQISKLAQNSNISEKTEGEVQHNKQQVMQITPVRTAIALLLQHPELIAAIYEEHTLLTTLDVKGVDLLCELMQVINGNPSMNTGRLLEFWRESEYGPYLMQLASRELNVPEAGLEAELVGTIKTVKRLHRQQRIEELLAKANIGTLDASEKDELQQLLAADRVPET